MRKTFSDGTSMDDIKKRANDKLADQIVREVLGKSVLIAVPLAAGIAVASHYLENAVIPQEYIQQVPYIARIGIDAVVGYLTLKHAMKPLVSIFDYYTSRKVIERDHSGNSIEVTAGKAYLDELAKQIEKSGIEGLPQEFNCPEDKD